MSEILSTDHIKAVLTRAKCLRTEEQVEQALERMARAIRADLQDEDPIVLCVLIGGIVLTGKLLTMMDFPLQVDYIHASRYGENIVGSHLKWIAKPRASLKNRTVLVVDDILDHGITLAGIVEHCYEEGAKLVKTAVLVEKEVKRSSSVIVEADYTGVVVEDRYVFGYGMDYKGYLRNVPGIFAVAKEDE